MMKLKWFNRLYREAERKLADFGVIRHRGFRGQWRLGWKFPFLRRIIIFEFPVLRRVFPELLAADIVSVQPMTAPVSTEFSYEYKFGEKVDGKYVAPAWSVGCKHGLGNDWGCICNCGQLYKTDRAAWVASNPKERK